MAESATYEAVASSSSSTNTTNASKNITVSAADARYTFDSDKLDELRKAVPWNNDPRYFKNVAVSPSAVMKMVREVERHREFYTSLFFFRYYFVCVVYFGYRVAALRWGVYYCEMHFNLGCMKVFVQKKEGTI
mmetsp:Transcript_28299/g.53408  ORF Transcript_28299/g.53408 Transcript_28299/m.53408 type:complete len:133 (+) Transcript_28299:135-533(+)